MARDTNNNGEDNRGPDVQLPPGPQLSEPPAPTTLGGPLGAKSKSLGGMSWGRPSFQPQKMPGGSRVANPHRRPTPSSRPVAIAATLGALGGLALFFDLSLHLFAPLGRSYFVIATVMALCLLGVPTAYWLRAAIAPGWKRLLGAAGASLVILGAAAWITAFVILFNHPDAAFTQRLTPAGSALMALGMLLLGVGVLASRRITGLRTLAPLAVGVYFPAQLIIQLTFFLNGQDAAPGPNGALLGTWGLLWAWAAWATLTPSRRNKG